MGITYAKLSLSNPIRPELAPIESDALADTGAIHLCIPEHIAVQLRLNESEKREATLADGSKKLVSYVGPLEIRFANRRCFVGAMVTGDEVLLGAIPMEDMDLIVRPMTREVLVNPAAPNIAMSVAKGCARQAVRDDNGRLED
jgi:clan AA aspartic protease